VAAASRSIAGSLLGVFFFHLCSSCSTIANLHETQLPQQLLLLLLQLELELQLLAAHLKSQVEPITWTAIERSVGRDKRKTHSFTFDVIATALQVASCCPLLPVASCHQLPPHDLCFIYRPKCEFIFGASLAKIKSRLLI